MTVGAACLGWGGCQCVPRLGWMSMCALVGVDVNVCLGWGGCQCVPRLGWMSMCA